jgi:AAA domain
MNASDLRPASQIAQLYGVKMLAYGGPGTGKTPLVQTAPYPVVMATEPGLLSLRNTNVPVWEAYTYPRMIEFYRWLLQSSEARQFQTVCIDSVSQMAEQRLNELWPQAKDKRQAYGEMSRNIMEILTGIYYARYMHVYLIAKQGELDINGVSRVRPFFPGQDLNVKVPHLYDLVLHVEYLPDPTGKTQRVFRTRDNYYTTARDRTGTLDEIEYAHLGNVIAKVMR